MTLTFAPHEIVQAFVDYTRRPNHAEFDALAAQGITIKSCAFDADGGGFGIGLADIERLDDGRFDFAEYDGKTAVVVVARNLHGDVADLVAFRRDGLILPYIGAVNMLGENNILAPRLDQALTIHRTPFDWLRDGREGVVLISPQRSANMIRDFGPFRAADVQHGLELRSLFAERIPTIVVPQTVEERRRAA